MLKKSGVIPIISCMLILLTISIVSSQASKLEISLTKDSFKAGEDITFKISLYDSQNNPINEQISLIFEDIDKTKKIETTVPSSKLSSINLGNNAPPGFWTITASYQEVKTSQTFSLEANELAKFELNNDVLTVINIGNTRYIKEITIMIGDIPAKKNLDLNVGESTSFRLVAPDGVYDIKITDGTTNVAKSGVTLSGNVVGTLDEKVTERNPLTANIKTESESNGFSSSINNTFAYIFVIAVIGAVILLAVERNYRKKISKN